MCGREFAIVRVVFYYKYEEVHLYDLTALARGKCITHV